MLVFSTKEITTSQTCRLCGQLIGIGIAGVLVTGNREILEFLHQESNCKTYRTLTCHKECLSKIKDNLEEIEHKGYTPLCSDKEWKRYMGK